MKYTNLGRTGLKVSRICLGTMNFFPDFVPDEESFAMLNYALDRGINYLDTANCYGDYFDTKNVGAVESVLGRWFNQDRSRRDRVVLATKVFVPMGEGPNDRGLSAYHIRKACDDSLRRLQTDHIDIYQMHHIDRSTPWEEIWQAMEVLVRQGKILYVGSSNFAGWHIAQAQEQASRRNLLGLVSEQSLYNLIDRTVELEVLPACQAYGLGFIAWSPLKSGMLAGVLQKKQEGRRVIEPWMDQAIEQHFNQLKAYEDLCKSIGESPAVIGLAWLLHRPGVTAPIIGPRTMKQMEDNLKALEIDLPKDVLDRLDEIFPGYKTAPEAYAW